MRCGEIFRNDMRRAASSAKKSLVGENKDDTKHEVRRVHTPMQNLFLELTVKMWIYRYFAETVTGSREGVGAELYAFVRDEL